jgi:hypothetical protein
MRIVVGYLNAFYMMAITAVVSVPLALLLKRVPTGR